MARKQVGAIDSELLDRVDVARGDVPRTRFVERALEATLIDGGHSVTKAEVVAPPAAPLSSASPRAPERGVGSFGRQVAEGVVPGLLESTEPRVVLRGRIAEIEGRPARHCEQCGAVVESPTLNRHGCGGRVLPEPV